ncbi:hypothetical protein J0B03_00590 [Alkalibacter rhizosphaerae]|uniref:Uncharacterized protein n=1 Tax=Alkalibacter rhizosphaerae TaxID=2815577 RepID=A0A974XF13_9FIRM|nr:hypothetical protein [Alkalibacter rhizosphaerae]QSX08623.1 hypothetical protein J0B03_00590 [Alkalibacter rhizosphaerae]
MLENLIVETRQDILVLTEALLQTNREVAKLPYFTKKNVKRSLEKALGMDLEALSDFLLELLPLLNELAQQVQYKRFDRVDRSLSTLKYKYLAKMDVLTKLSAYYREPAAPLTRYLTKKELLDQTLAQYGKRLEISNRVFDHLHAVYDTMNVENM